MFKKYSKEVFLLILVSLLLISISAISAGDVSNSTTTSPTVTVEKQVSMSNVIKEDTTDNKVLSKNSENIQTKEKTDNKKTIKRLYDKFGYKGLDILLFNYYMNQELNPLYLSFPQRNGDYITTDIIAFFNVTNNNTNIEINNIKSILTEDNEFIEDKEEILRYIKKTYDRIFENKEKR